jgi:hypothetical protein
VVLQVLHEYQITFVLEGEKLFIQKLLKSAIIASVLIYTAQSQAFVREFTQNDDPSVFHAENSSAELCLFVYSRQGVLMIQPHCMVSTSSHQQASAADITSADN